MSGAVVKFHYPTHTLAELQGLGLGEQLFLPPTLDKTPPPSSPPCPPPSPPCPPPTSGSDEDEILLGA